MRKTVLVLGLCILSSLFFSACETYDEGPGFTLTSKTARITKTWALKSINTSELKDEILWVFEKNGNHTKTYNNYPSNNPAVWSFGDEKTLEIYYIEDNKTSTYTILKLTSSELVLSEKLGAVEIKYAFETE